jgi:hypothetical protein
MIIMGLCTKKSHVRQAVLAISIRARLRRSEEPKLTTGNRSMVYTSSGPAISSSITNKSVSNLIRSSKMVNFHGFIKIFVTNTTDYSYPQSFKITQGAEGCV